MIRAGFFTDIHLTENAPCHRLDDYIKTQAQKLESAYNVFVQNGCDFVMFGGDFYDRHIIASKYEGQIISSYKIVNTAIKIMKESGLMTYACIGEHDLYGHHVSTYPESTLAFMADYCPEFRILWTPEHLANGISLYPKHEWQKMTDVDKTVVDSQRFNILVCHELLHIKKMPFETVYTKELTLPYDLVVCGDLHCGFEPHKVGKTWYANPGSLVRKTTADSKRMPKVLLIDIEHGYEPIIREVILPCAKKGSEVLGIGIAETVRSFETDLDISGFASGFDALTAHENTDIYRLFEDFRANNGVRSDVLDYYKKVKQGLQK